MAGSFSPATAEQVVAAVEAVLVNGKATHAEFVAEFSDLPKEQAEKALNLATHLGLLHSGSGRFSVASPLCRFLSTPNQIQKAAVLRVLLESYKPFLVFRERLIATGIPANAAQQTKAALGLSAHREEIKDTLLGLGTYSQAMVTGAGGLYHIEDNPSENILKSVANACSDAAQAEARIRKQIGDDFLADVSREEVIVPLADALVRAKSGDSQGAVLAAGNAVESFLDGLAPKLTVGLAGATGINSKLDKFKDARKLPKKLVQVGKYLGHIRNAADHGIDTEIGVSWIIRESTGIEYVFVACSFLAASTAHANEEQPQI